MRDGQPDQSRPELLHCFREARQGSIGAQVDGCPTRVQERELSEQRRQQVRVTFGGPADGHRAPSLRACFKLVFQVVERRGAKLGCTVLLPDVDASRLPIVTHSRHHRSDDLISQGLDRRTRAIGAADERTDLGPVSLEHGRKAGPPRWIGDPGADPRAKRHSGRSGRGWATRPAGPRPVLRLGAICGGRPRSGGPAGSHRPPTA